MSALRTELRILRWPLLGLSLSLVVAVASAFFSLHLIRQAEKRADAAELNAANSRNATQRLQREEQDIRSKIAAYQALAERGIIGAERRLDWVDLMRSVQHKHRLLGLEYEIHPRQPWPGDISNGTGHAFMFSAMKVQLPLLHEEDLLRFLDDVQAEAPAFARLRSCRLQRNTAPPADSRLAPQINAECQLDWITLMPENAAK